MSKTIKKLAEERSIVVITTPHDTFTVARLINQSIPVKYFMSTENLTSFNTLDYVEMVKEEMAKKEISGFSCHRQKRRCIWSDFQTSSVGGK